MSLLLENSSHSHHLQSVVMSWNTQYDQHDLLLICKSGHRVTTRQSLLSLYSPLVRTILANIPFSGVMPAISVDTDVRAVSGLICLLSNGNISSEHRDDLEEVEKAANSLGFALHNCEMVDNTFRRTKVVDNIKNVSVTPIMSVDKITEKNTESLEEVIERNGESNETVRLEKREIRVATSIFKTNEAKGQLEDNSSAFLAKMDLIKEQGSKQKDSKAKMNSIYKSQLLAKRRRLITPEFTSSNPQLKVGKPRDPAKEVGLVADKCRQKGLDNSTAKQIFISKDGKIIGHKISIGAIPIVAGIKHIASVEGKVAPPKQKVQIVKKADGKFQVRGLLPGQQLVQMTDGKLQISVNLKATDKLVTGAKVFGGTGFVPLKNPDAQRKLDQEFKQPQTK